MRMFLSPGSNVKTEFSPTRVMVLSGAVISRREFGPVRTMSGALKISCVTAGVTALSDAATTLACLMISVKVLSVSGSAACAATLTQIANPTTRNLIFMSTSL